MNTAHDGQNKHTGIVMPLQESHLKIKKMKRAESLGAFLTFTTKCRTVRLNSGTVCGDNSLALLEKSCLAGVRTRCSTGEEGKMYLPNPF